MDKEVIGISRKVVVSKDIKHIPQELTKVINQKQLSYDLAQDLLKYVNEFVPKKSGDLRKNGYVLRLGNKNEKGPWFSIQYRNTKALPYVMYQYYGEIYGPNSATFEFYEDLDMDTLALHRKYKHVGWSSPKHKEPTGRMFSRRKRTFMIKKGRYKGSYVTINGYTTNKRKVQPMWLEYVRDNKYVWDSPYHSMVLRVERVCKEALEKKLK